MNLGIQEAVDAGAVFSASAGQARKSRTLLIHQAFAAPDQPGGTRHYELARRLVAQGHEFVIVTSDLSYLTGERLTRPRLMTEQSLDGVRVLRVWTCASLHRSFIWRVISFFSFALTSIIAALRAGRVDLVMGTTPSIFQAASAMIVAAIRRRPFLLEVRDLWPAFAIDMGVLRSPVLIGISRWLERTLYRRATHVLVNSPAYRDYLIGQAVPAAKISVIPNGVEPGQFHPDAHGEDVRRQYGLAGRFLITYAGALGMANDIDTILRAADRLRHDSHIHFLFVGDGKERRNLEQKARVANLTNVTFTGAQPKHRIPRWLEASDACVATLQDIPMFRTTYPNKVFDYMAAARPTILAIDGVIRDVVERAEGGIFVPPGNDRALADAVLHLSRNPDVCERMGARARAYVIENFDRGRQAQQFCELICRVTQQS